MIFLTATAAPIPTETVLTIVLIVAVLCVVAYFAPKLPALAQWVIYGAIVLIALLYLAMRLGLVG